MLKSGKQIWSVSILSNSVAKLGQAWGSIIIVISYLQSVPKLWHVECWSMFSIAHRSAFTSECKGDSRRVKFLAPISWMFPPLFIQTHLHPLKWAEAVQDPCSKQILPKLIVEPKIYTKYLIVIGFDLGKTNNVGNDIFRTQRC